MAEAKCDHGLVFDEKAAAKLLAGWRPTTEDEFIMGNPASSEVQKRWPRLSGLCPKGCGFNGIAYVSMTHYRMGDW